MLEIQNLVARYGDFQALFGIDFAMRQGEVIALIGANGAGKSTFLKSIAGQMRSKAGVIRFNNENISALPSDAVVRRGIAMVPEGRRLFPSLTVEENLRVGAFTGRAGHWTMERIFALFPVLMEKRKQRATSLSGGQQQMVAIARALMSNPDLLMCDELSLGLSPAVMKDIYAAFPQMRAEGLSAIVVEQDIDAALAVADHVYCFMHGRITLHGKPQDLTKDSISAAYFGLAES